MSHKAIRLWDIFYRLNKKTKLQKDKLKFMIGQDDKSLQFTSKSKLIRLCSKNS